MKWEWWRVLTQINFKCIIINNNEIVCVWESWRGDVNIACPRFFTFKFLLTWINDIRKKEEINFLSLPHQRKKWWTKARDDDDDGGAKEQAQQ